MAVVEIVLLSRFGAIECRSVYHINSVLDTTADAEQACDQLWTWLATNHLPDAHTSYTYYGAMYRNISVAGMPSMAASVSPQSGANTDQLLPRQTQALVSWRAAAPPPNAARKYLAGYTEASNTPEGNPAAGTIGRLTAFAEAVVAHNNGVGGADYKYVAVKKDPATGLAIANNPLSVPLARSYWAVLTSRRN